MDKGIPFGSYADRLGGQLSEVGVTPDIPQGRVLGPLLLLAYLNDIWKNTVSTITLFANDCVVCRKTVNNNDLEKLQIELGRLVEWAVENGMKSKAFTFTRALVKDPLN